MMLMMRKYNTTATDTSKFYANAAKYNNELYYEINLTNIHTT